MSALIAPLIGTSLELMLGLIKMAREAKELSKQEFDAIKKKIDKDFAEFLEIDWDKL